MASDIRPEQTTVQIERTHYGTFVRRCVPGKDPDKLGSLTRHGSLITAHLSFGGFSLRSAEFADEQKAIDWLASHTESERERLYEIEDRAASDARRARADQDRRERPWWYNDDGSHIGIRSDGSFRGSRRGPQ